MPIYEINGVRPTLGRDVFIAPSATIIGDVHLGDEASVWFGGIIRGDYFPIRIGARTNVQDNAVVHITAERASTKVGDDVTIGHLALIHGCTVGNRCLIGMGSILLDGAEIGDESLVAAGALVPPGKKFPARSFIVGAPAKVIRTVTDDDFAWIRHASKVYVEYARDFAAKCRAVG
jgi:carbonic anhydrase/acetyltransferase-like protein (isoleucine patch superfamily)